MSDKPLTMDMINDMLKIIEKESSRPTHLILHPDTLKFMQGGDKPEKHIVVVGVEL